MVNPYITDAKYDANNFMFNNYTNITTIIDEIICPIINIFIFIDGFILTNAKIKRNIVITIQ